VVLVTEDVGQHGEVVAFLDQAHGDARDRRLDRHAGVHQRQEVPQTEAIELEPLDSVISETTRSTYGNSSGSACTAITPRGQATVTDLAALRRQHEAGLTDAERREVVVQHEGILVLPSIASMICASRPVPRVVTTMAWVSPRVNSAEPWVRGSTPTWTSIGRTVVVAAVDARLAVEI
jgi:hypothetical protein